MSRSRATAAVSMAACLLFIAPAGRSQQQPPPGEEKELEKLLSVLQQETDVATRTRMNSDFVPGIVTVLQGDELRALGAETVWEALSLVPGVQPVLDDIGNRSVVVRGIDFPFNSGNVKILVDGVPLTREAAGVDSSVLDIPVVQIDRIEFIRGPGSVIHGEFALMGLINIVTRKEGPAASLLLDSHRTISASAIVGGSPVAGWKLTTNVGGLYSDRATAPIGRSGRERKDFAFITLDHGGLSLAGQIVQRRADDTTVAALPGSIASNASTSGVRAKYRWSIGALSATARGDFLQERIDRTLLTYHDRELRGGIDVEWTGLARQTWLASAEHTALDFVAASLAVPPPPGSGQPPPPATIVRGKKRTIDSVALEDRFDVSPRVSVTAGARYDRYSDVGSRTTPRVAAVFRVSDRHILKAQYAEGFRSPTFFELYNGARLNPDLTFEVNRTIEANYVYKIPAAVGRLTLFHSHLASMIFPGLTPGGLDFANNREAHSNGVEAEWTQQLGERWKVMANATRAHTADTRGPALMAHEDYAAPKWMSDVALLARPASSLVAALHWVHVGERSAVNQPAFDLVGLTLTRRDLPISRLALSIGVRNALDRRTSYSTTQPYGSLVTPFDDRRVWIQAQWSR